MRSITLLLCAVFCNFFGFYIVDSYLWNNGLSRSHIFLPNGFTEESIVERLSIFVACIFVAIYAIKVRKAKTASPAATATPQAAFVLLSTILLATAVYNLINIGSFSQIADRGLDQRYVTSETVLTRFAVLLVPLFLFYLIRFFDDRRCRWITAIFLLSVVADSIASGDRRSVFYFVISFVLFYLSYRKNVEHKGFGMKSVVLGAAVLSLFLASYYVRSKFSGNVEINDAVFLVLQGTVGALGIGEILPAVKQIISLQGGHLLWGESFLGYLLGLFIPSIVTVPLGIDLGLIRPSLEFDSIVNQNPNMGYDFMMLADFYWNFGILGYVMYVAIFAAVCLFAVHTQDNIWSDRFPSYVLMLVFFISGQRSDFGLFLKSWVYCIAVYYIIGLVFARRKNVHAI